MVEYNRVHGGAMKVSNKNKSSLAQLISKKEVPFKKHNPNLGKANHAGMVDSAKVTLSPRSKNIKVASQIAKENQVDEARVQHLQNLIDSGKYNIDSAKVADRLVDEHLKMST